MGLDMYLDKRRRGSEEKPESVFYWRKANEIHRWFGERLAKDGVIKNCTKYEVNREDLEALKDACAKVLSEAVMVSGKVRNGQRLTENGFEDIMEDGKYVVNTDVCEKYLPTMSGFFFGGTNYDQWYMEDISETYEMCCEVLEEFDFDQYELIYSSWW